MAPRPVHLTRLTTCRLFGENGSCPGDAGQADAAGALVDAETLVGNGNARKGGLGGLRFLGGRAQLEERDGLLG